LPKDQIDQKAKKPGSKWVHRRCRLRPLKLDEEYRVVRAAVVNAGVDMTDSMDALYRDWRRWRDKLEPLAADSVGIVNADQWLAHGLGTV
jgi:hypothetical protein